MRKNQTKDISIVGGEGISIVGSVTANSDMVIRCNIQGNIMSDANVTVEAGAVINGNVKASKLVVDSGTILGNIEASSVKLGTQATVTGDITYSTIEIDEGALFNGNCIVQSVQISGTSRDD